MASLASDNARVCRLEAESLLTLLLNKDITSDNKKSNTSGYPCRQRYAPGKMTEMIRRGQLIREQYAEWLQGYNWDYFLTSTFRKPRKEPYYALQSVWHVLQSDFVARAFLVAEPHQSGDLHIHGLAAGSGAGWRPELALPWDIWTSLFKRFGRAKVEACNTQEAVTGYCAKYLLKQQSRVCDYYEIFGRKRVWFEGMMKKT